MKLIIIGYSGHSYVCIDIALMNDIVLDGYCDLKPNTDNPYNLLFMGSEQYLKTESKIFICVADNKIRKRIFSRVINLDSDINLVHPDSIISHTVEMGYQTLICGGSIINAQVKIGNCCIINSGCIIEHQCEISDFSHIAPSAVLCGNVVIGEGSFIGANSVIKQGVKIGRNVTVGAGSVVLKDIPDNSVYVGSPAKFVKSNTNE